MLAQIVLATFYVTCTLSDKTSNSCFKEKAESQDTVTASGSPTFGRYPRIESEPHLDQLVQDSNNKAEVQAELLQATTNSSLPSELELILLKQLIDLRRLRQDNLGEAGLEVGQNVGEIITGVLGGGLTNVFEGSTSFIGNQGVQEEVQTVLGNVAPVFQTILKYGWGGLKNYFGIGVTSTTTEENAVTAAVATTPQVPLLVPVFINGNQTQLTPEQQKNLQHQQMLLYEITLLQHRIQQIVEDSDATTFSTIKTDDNEEDADLDRAEGNDEIVANYPLLVHSRVERVH